MNIENFEPIKGITFNDLFEKQTALNFMYEPNEKTVYEQFDIDCLDDQEHFKRYCWRIVEELTEALEALDNNEKTHVFEELMDGFNFFTEMLTMYGWTPSDLDFSYNIPVISNESDLRLSICEAFKEIGLAANCLKNRGWRQSQYLVDLYVFEKRLKKAFNVYLNLLRSQMGSDEKILDYWSLKYQVNLFRVNTRY